MPTSPPSPAPATAPDTVIRTRWLGLLIWQSILSVSLYLLSAPLLLFPPRRPTLLSLLSFLSFLLSVLLFSISLFLISSPHPPPYAFFSLSSLLSSDSRSDRLILARAATALFFAALCTTSGFLSLSSLCGDAVELTDAARLIGLGFRGLVLGAVFSRHYISSRRWVLRFPIVQRPIFYRFKMGLPSAFNTIVRASVLAFIFSSVFIVFLPKQYKSKETIGSEIIRQIRIFMGTCIVSVCWEMSHLLLQVLHTRRANFSPPKGSAAAETNPCEGLLETLEDSIPNSLPQYLAYLDLCMIAESNTKQWYRAAFFEESGETYRRIVRACLRPLEQFTSTLADALEPFSTGNVDFISQRTTPATKLKVLSGLYEASSNFQVCAWCARTLAVLTAHSCQEDRYGIAQLTGSNKAIVSTLLSALHATESCLGRKSNLQSSDMLGPANIKWAVTDGGRKVGGGSPLSIMKNTEVQNKVYAMADILRTSIYQIVSAFEADMKAHLKASLLDKNWVMDEKPLYGTRADIVLKLRLFVQYQAV